MPSCQSACSRGGPRVRAQKLWTQPLESAVSQRCSTAWQQVGLLPSSRCTQQTLYYHNIMIIMCTIMMLSCSHVALAARELPGETRLPGWPQQAGQPARKAVAAIAAIRAAAAGAAAAAAALRAARALRRAMP